MSLVGGYPPQAYHPAGPATISHDLYGYPHPQTRYQEAPHPVADTGAFYQNWMLNAPADMTVPTDSYGLGGGVGAGGIPPHLQDGQYMNMQNMMSMVDPHTGRVRVVKRRGTANKKERRRTVSINTAFAKLRGCIPNVPSDTKLSKIKTLRLATSYIAYLMDVLNKDDPKLAEAGFKADLVKIKKETKKHTETHIDTENISTKTTSSSNSNSPASSSGSSTPADSSNKKSKGRTGWPQHVWAAELKS